MFSSSEVVLFYLCIIIIPYRFSKLFGVDLILFSVVSNQKSHDNKPSGDTEFVDIDSVDSDHGDDTCPTTGEMQETDDVIDSLSESEQCQSPVFVQKRILADRDSLSFSPGQDTTTSGRVDTCNHILQSIHGPSDCVFRTEVSSSL